MSSWTDDFLAKSDDSRRQIVRRARHGLHFDLGRGRVRAHFTGAPCHYRDSDGLWKPISTRLQLDSSTGKYGAPGIATRFDLDGTIMALRHSQRNTRIGIYRPRQEKFTPLIVLPSGVVANNTMIRETRLFSEHTFLKEDGIKQNIVVNSVPAGFGQAISGDILCVETLIDYDLPDGLVSELPRFAEYVFPEPHSYDDSGRRLKTLRYAKKVGVSQYIYTGVLVIDIELAKFPLTIDPDFSGDTADGYIEGISSSWSTARGTASSHGTSDAANGVGAYSYSTTFHILRQFCKFDTSSIPDGDTITQVNLKLTCEAVQVTGNNLDVQIVKQDWSSQDPIASGNREAAYDNCLSGTLDDAIWQNTSGLVAGTQYVSGNLNTGWVSKTGNTYYSLRSSLDYDNDPPPASPNTFEFMTIRSSDHATPGDRPILTVEYGTGFVQQVVMF
ncbi:MAG: hypothetical protein HN413_08075 [Chloroflexi bacterium]|jgi:hypothetical protein|nr:hypothetical protein [Chloroflexota bacterium]